METFKDTKIIIIPQKVISHSECTMHTGAQFATGPITVVCLFIGVYYTHVPICNNMQNDSLLVIISTL